MNISSISIQKHLTERYSTISNYSETHKKTFLYTIFLGCIHEILGKEIFYIISEGFSDKVPPC
jgi:hypothetical protein